MLDQAAIADLRRKHLPGSLSVSYADAPLHMVRGDRQYLFTAAGDRYLDCVNNVCHVGHCHPRVVAAGQEQLAVLNTNTRYLHDNIVRYAERITATLPDRLSVCFFTCTGSEANDLAQRLARAHTGRRRMLCLEHAYHGNSVSTIEVSPYKFDAPGGDGCPPTTTKVPIPDMYKGRFTGPDCCDRYLDALRDAVAAGDPPAAFYCESIPGCGGQVVLPDGYMRRAFEIVRGAGGVCIADEVQVGFGRVGSHFWGFQTQDALPDIVTMGKPAGNGFPIGIVATTPEIANCLKVEYFNTFGGSPVAMAVGLAVLDAIAADNLQANAHFVGLYFKGKLVELQTKYRAIGDVRGLGLFIGIELVTDPESKAPATDLAREVVGAMKHKHNILLSVDGPDNNVIKIKPPMCFSARNALEVVQGLDEVMGDLVPAVASVAKPRFSPEQVAEAVGALWGPLSGLSALPSYDDQNYRAKMADGTEVVVKIANDAFPVEILEMQNSVMDTLAKGLSGAGVSVPRVVPSKNGRPIEDLVGPDKTRFFVRLLTFIPGSVYAKIEKPTSALWRNLGQSLAALDRALVGYRHPGAERYFDWDLAHAGAIVGIYSDDIGDPARRTMVQEHYLAEYIKRTRPLIMAGKLRRAVIHGDANEFNLIADGATQQVTGLIDFGDVIESHLVNNVAISSAYAAIGQADPIETVFEVVSAYHAAFPLTREELEAVPLLMFMRLAVSVSMSSYAIKQEPDNTYLVASQAGAFAVLEKCRDLSLDDLIARFVALRD